MNTIENSSHVAKQTTRTRPLRLWPWCVGLIVVLITLLGASIWWRAHQAYQLTEFVAENQGQIGIEYDHPHWMAGFVDNQTYLPWCDEIYKILAPNAPTSEILLRGLLRQQSLRHIHLDISQLSHEDISQLGSLDNLETVGLEGNGEKLPMEWTQKLPKLDELYLSNIPISADQWSMLISLPGMNTLIWSDTSTHLRDSANAPYLILTTNRLTQAHAKALLDINGLKYLDLHYFEAEPEFWDTLSELRELEALQLANIDYVTFELSARELQAFQQIPTLKHLQLIEHADLSNKEQVSEAWKIFFAERPDISVKQGY